MVADLLNFDEFAALADTESKLVLSSSAITRFSTIFRILALSDGVANFAVLTCGIDDRGTVREAIIKLVSSVNGLKACHTGALSCCGEVLSIETLAAARNRANV